MSSPARPKRAAASRSTIKAESPGSESSALSEEDVKPPKKTPRTSKVKEAISAKAELDDNKEDVTVKKGKAAPKRAKAPKAEDGEEDAKPVKKPRVLKASIFPPTDLLPSLHPPRKGFPAHTFPEISGTRNGGIQPTERGNMPLLIGAHTSIAGGPATALLKAGMLGANGLAMFVKSQRQWKAKDYEPESVERFRELMKSKEEGGESGSSKLRRS